MSSVESRIVTMKFENSQFQRAANETMSTFQKLKAALSFDGLKTGVGKIGSSIGGLFGKLGTKINPFASAQKGVTDLQSATNRFSPSAMTGGVSSISKSFLAMSTIAITALSTVVSKAVNAGLSIAKSLTIDPVLDGFREYETNMNSIQTILSNTGLKGEAGLAKVNGALAELNTYADQTIYNFSEMARNIGTFTAAGVDLKTATASIKGIANLAAISGSNSQQASTAMYQLSQAISAGRVGLQDWNSVVNAGMGGKVFQTALARTAVNMGTLGDKSVGTAGKMKRLTIDGKSFRESITAKPGEQSWLTSDVLTSTLKQFGGNMTRAQLKAEGFKKAQIDAIMEMGKMGTDAATKVKTLSQLMGTLKEAVGSGWAKSFQLILGNFGEAKTLFTSVSNTLGGLIGASSDARNKVLGDWAKMGGRTAIIDSIRNAFVALMSILKPIKQAFQDIFPPVTGAKLAALSKQLREFTEGLKLGKDSSEDLRRTFRGVFAIFSIVGQAIGAAVGMFLDLFGVVGSGAGSFLNFTGGIGDFLVSLDNAIRKSNIFGRFFSGLGAILAIPLHILGSIAGLIAGLFTGLDSGGLDSVGASFQDASDRMQPLIGAGSKIREAFSGLGSFFQNLGGHIVEALSGIGEALGNAISSQSFGGALDAINVGLLGGIVLMLKKFVAGGLKINIGDGLFGKVKESLDAVTGTLKTMQTSVKADIILKIAGALAILAAAVLVLALIDPVRLTTALAAMAAGFAALQFAMVSLNVAIGVIGSAKLVAIATAMVILAAAMVIFASAIKIMASIELGDMVKGLGGIAAVLFILTKAVVPLSANSGGMIKAGAGLILLALALKIMASAIQDFADISWEDLGKGLAGVAGSLVVLAGAMKIMPTNIFVTSAALVVLAVALKIMATAVQDFANISWNDMVKGFVGIAVALGILAAAMRLMPTNMALQAASLVVLGVALKIIGSAIASMGGLSMEEIAKGLGTLAAALSILAAALYLMTGTLLGAAALVVAAGALALLAPVLIALGSMSWEAIAKGLTALAAALAIIGVAGLLLTPIIPSLIGLGAALVLIGAGLALAGVAALAFASAFTLVVAAGAAGVSVLAGILNSIISSIPAAMKAFATGIVAFTTTLAANAPKFFQSMGVILTGMINAVIAAIPKVARLFQVLLNTALRVVVSSIPRIVQAGFTLITRFLLIIQRNVPRIVGIALQIIVSFLGVIARNIGRIIAAGTNLLVKFLAGITRQMPKIVAAGTKAIVSFINGVANNIGKVINAGINLAIKFINGVANGLRSHQGELNGAGANLAGAIVSGMAGGIRAGIGSITSAAVGAARSALSAAKNALGVKSPSKEFFKVGKWSSVGMAEGISTYSRVVDKASENVGKSALGQMKATMSGLTDNLVGDMNVNPVITPVLDLSGMRSGAKGIDSLLANQKMSTSLSSSRASSISADVAAALAAQGETATAPVVKEIKFEQHNNSPKALSAVEIYRNTRNLISLAQEGLNA